ncbi:MAG: adenosylcobinamide-GDP ribazoletransferase [Coriobacteriia bacterium]|nr:adenosylcobinamide-GDP ribazoletransferase [Coriobacteriia bacterium]
MTAATEDGRTRPNPLVDAAAAVGFLTLLPLGRVWPDGRPPRSVGWYPWVGWLLGALAAGPLWLVLRSVGHAPVKGALLVGALVVSGWALLTRFLHWDGLADTFDGIWGGQTVERRLEIMRDSRIGSFGAAAMIMVALVQAGAIADFVAEGVWWPLLLAPVAGRAAVSLAAWTMPAARREGLGLSSIERPGLYDVVVWAAACVLCVTVLPAPWPVAGAFVAGVALAALAVPRLLARPVGGMTGDLFGATVLIVETVVLVMGAVIA